MTSEERGTVGFTVGLLLLASLVRFGWEARPLPPVLPPEEVPDALLEETREALRIEERRRTPLAPGERIDPNRAPEVELSRLPGIGPSLAARVIESRDREGPFHSSEDLMRVSGIGSATLERIAPLLDLDGPPTRFPAVGRSPSRLDLNRAEREALMELPGIGPALADRIVEHRARNGLFGTVEDLVEVPGIGPTTLDRLRPMLRVTR